MFRNKLKWLLTKLHWLPDPTFLRWGYRLETGRRLELDNPVTFNDKLNWLKLHGDTERHALLVDKLGVRGFVAATIGHEHLVPLICQYARPEDVLWDALPDKYVVKCTHGSHCGIVVNDKRNADKSDMIKRLNKWMGRNWYWHGREPPYKHLKPRIIVEQLLGDGVTPPEDYKIMCFDGEPEYVQVHRRDGRQTTIDIYTAYGDRVIGAGKVGYANVRSLYIDRRKLRDMLPIARALAKATGAPYVRVDLYHEGGRVYFGELTFFDSAGFRDFYPPKLNVEMGHLIKLPNDGGVQNGSKCRFRANFRKRDGYRRQTR